MRYAKACPCLLILVALHSGFAAAQAFNIDTGTGTVPSSSFGAVPGQVGIWNQPSSFTISALTAADGSATGATINASISGGASFSIGGANPDENAMMSSAWLMGGVNNSIGISHLEPGVYDIYVYCFGGNGSTPIKVLNSLSSTTQTVENPSVWPGAQLEGVTYMKARIQTNAVTTGFAILYLQANGNRPLNGIQIVPVPAPAGASLLVGGVFCLAPRRRRTA